MQYDNGKNAPDLSVRGDFNDWVNSIMGDAYGGSGVINLGHAQQVSGIDLREMNVLGWTLI